jgi:hypothetical protein
MGSEMVRLLAMDESIATTGAPSAESVFSPDDDLSTLWIKAYQGEVSGERLFGRLAQRVEEADHRRKLDVLRVLEARTRSALVPAMEHQGLPTDPDPQVERDAESLADAAASLPWSDLLAAFEPITTQFLGLYERISELARDEDKAVAALLVAHEEALREFARRELSGRGDDSLSLITALPHMR